MIAGMHARPILKTVLWLACSIAALALVVWLVLFLLDSTNLTVATDRRSMSTATELGQTVCTKHFKASFPFVTLECQPRTAD